MRNNAEIFIQKSWWTDLHQRSLSFFTYGKAILPSTPALDRYAETFLATHCAYFSLIYTVSREYSTIEYPQQIYHITIKDARRFCNPLNLNKIIKKCQKLKRDSSLIA